MKRPGGLLKWQCTLVPRQAFHMSSSAFLVPSLLSLHGFYQVATLCTGTLV